MSLPKKMWAAEFTLAIGCPISCHYCPQENLIKGYIDRFGKDELYMSFETFKICLSKLIPNSGIAFGGMVEPFKNKDCAKMIKYAYEQGFKIALDTTLMGMTEEDFELIKDVKFEHFQLHIPDKEGLCNFVISDMYLKIFGWVNDKFNITGYSCHGHVHEAVETIVKQNENRIPLFDQMMNRAGNLSYEELRTYENKGALACCSGSDKITGWLPEILPNGTVILCCMDYSMEHVLGNLVEQEWDQIVSGKEFIKVEQGMFDESLNTLCRRCSAVKQRNMFSYGNLLAPNAIYTNRILHNIKCGTIKLADFEDKLCVNKLEIVKKVVAADDICVFGLGKLFRDNYKNSCWEDLLEAQFGYDNNYKEGMETFGLEILTYDELKREGLLIVIYVSDSASIERQLLNDGITNYITISELYDLFWNVWIK